MTVAICLKCGEFKHGAWTRCQSCFHVPRSSKDKAKHLIVTDHHLSFEVLEKVSSRVKSGNSIHIKQEDIQDIVLALKNEFPEQPIRKSTKGFPFRIAIIFAFVATILIFIFTR